MSAEQDQPIGSGSISAMVVKIGDDLVNINWDGTLVYGSDYTPDAAAELFWEAIARRAPGVFDGMVAALKNILAAEAQVAWDQGEELVLSPEQIKQARIAIAAAEGDRTQRAT